MITYKKTLRKLMIFCTLLLCLIWVVSTDHKIVQAQTCDECLDERAACRIECGSGNTACLNNCNIIFNHCMNFCDDDPGGGGGGCMSNSDCLYWAGEYCINGICQYSTDVNTCQNGAVCPNGTTCQWNGSGWMCVQ